MKANGRRRWRKARAPRGKGRVFYGPDTKRGNAAKESSNAPTLLVDRVADWMRRHQNSMRCEGKTAAQWYDWLPPKPFAPRSLVGMSQRHRKALFHREFDAARETEGDNKGTVSMFVADALLAKYRIGQRLRPCPGCLACSRNDWSGDFFDSLNPTCDGSGVLPASRATGGRGR